MKNLKLVCVGLITFMFLPSLLAQEKQPFLHEKLQVFAPYFGTWQATFKGKDGKPDVIDVSHWDRALNGMAIKAQHSINNGDYGGETIIFWDDKKQKLVFFYFTTANFYTQGEMEMITDTSFVAYEDVTGNVNGITRVKSISHMSTSGMTVNTSYLREGEWTEPESRTYTRSDKTVIFK